MKQDFRLKYGYDVDNDVDAEDNYDTAFSEPERVQITTRWD